MLISGKHTLIQLSCISLMLLIIIGLWIVQLTLYPVGEFSIRMIRPLMNLCETNQFYLVRVDALITGTTPLDRPSDPVT